jgi:hypothetical protein
LVHISKAFLFQKKCQNPNITIRNFFIAVGGRCGGREVTWAIVFSQKTDVVVETAREGLRG